MIVPEVVQMLIDPVLSTFNVRQFEFAYKNPIPKNLVFGGRNPEGRLPITSPAPVVIVSSFEKFPVATISTIFPYLA